MGAAGIFVPDPAFCYFPVLPSLWPPHASLGVLVEQLPEWACVCVCV